MTLKMKQEFKIEEFKRELKNFNFTPKNKETLLKYVEHQLYQIYLIKNKPDFDNILQHDFLKLPPELELEYNFRVREAQSMKFNELKEYLLKVSVIYYEDYNEAYPNIK